MSAPTTHDPLVVNTQDGVVWQRRALTREGRGLYAVADAPACCPEYVMATLAELAEHGLASMLDALPMPVGPAPQPMSAERIQEITESHPGDWYSGAWTTEYYQVKQFAEYLVKHQESDTVLAELPDWAGPIALFMADAHDAVPELVAEVGRLRTRVAELEAERHSTNEALDDEVQALRERPDGITRLIAPTQALRDDVTPQVQKLRDLLSGQRAAVEDPHESPLHHSYLVPRDLPEPGGA